MSPFLTGPFTFLTRVLFTAPVNCTLTCVIPPLEPTHKHAQLDTTGIRTGRVDSETSEPSQARDDDPDTLDSRLLRSGRPATLTGFADDLFNDGVHDFTRVHVV